MKTALAFHIPAFLVVVFAVGRATRLLVFDDFPPTRAIREWWVRTVGEKWGPLFLCPFCLAPYLAAGDVAWYLWGYWGPEEVFYAWWVVNVWAALAYLAAIVVAYDQPEE